MLSIRTAFTLFVSLVCLLCCAAAVADATLLPRPNSKNQKGGPRRNNKAKRSAAAPIVDDDAPAADPLDDAIKYKGLLSCRACETVVEQLALMHHTTALPVGHGGAHDGRSAEKKARMQLQTRNAEILDGVCAALIAKNSAAGEQGDVQMLQLHCDRVVGASERRFGQFLSSLAANASRLYVPVGEDKNDKTGRITPLFAYASEKDAMCKRFCVEKNSMKEQMAKMQEEIKKKQMEHMNISMYEIFGEAIGILLGYWYLSVPAILLLTAIGLYLQIKYLAPRDANGRPILRSPPAAAVKKAKKE